MSPLCTGGKKGNYPAETHNLSDQAIGLVSALDTCSKQKRNSHSVGSGHRAYVSTAQVASGGTTREKLTFCRIRPLGSCQHTAPVISRGSIIEKLTFFIMELTSARGSGIKNCNRYWETYPLLHEDIGLVNLQDVNDQWRIPHLPFLR